MKRYCILLKRLKHDLRRLSWSLNLKGLLLRGFSAFAQSTLVFFILKENARGNVRRSVPLNLTSNLLLVSTFNLFPAKANENIEVYANTLLKKNYKRNEKIIWKGNF